MVNIFFLGVCSETVAHYFVVDYKVLLGEMQLSFVCLLMAQNFSGFNQWKQLVQLLCSCPQLMEETPDMFVEFMGKRCKFLQSKVFILIVYLLDVLEFQLDECPDDFFRDILSENNFTGVMLKVQNGILKLGNVLIRCQLDFTT